jgi:hypothetical protein
MPGEVELALPGDLRRVAADDFGVDPHLDGAGMHELVGGGEDGAARVLCGRDGGRQGGGRSRDGDHRRRRVLQPRVEVIAAARCQQAGGGQQAEAASQRRSLLVGVWATGDSEPS